MHPSDCTASAKAGFFPGGFQALSPALAMEIVLAMVLGWGLSAESFNLVLLSDSHASVPAQATPSIQEIKAEPRIATVAVNRTANAVPPAKAWAGPGDSPHRSWPHRTWPQRSERDVTGLEGVGCTAECLKILRQRLLDHHRQAAPVWVF